MKVFKTIAWVLLIAFVGIQFFPTERNQSEAEYASDFMEVNTVPPMVQNKIKVSCYDCHSNNTKYPWYNKVQPVAWFLEDHIEEGKNELNFNEWGDYSDRRKNSKLRSIISQIEDDEMPLDSYTFIHRDAKFSESEKKEILKYMTQLKNKL
ncbi:heme-binding domain-containing protein [Galbibacter pacificus]|uniref:Heme-binding domain-containing protein n=1 Tax=Galbibacter pacificus TaxID=2996052 RepID=A0ABT6FSV2_9FLAO|nr:heme-binding domain-containing protein [Galbibacter pacificus]MDG3582527.1 heme-binding domain-containing protein [Galbibacter pacificus]MDG3586354.1 heme-binding domain-containing protein [Galbibacter pacificus]